VTLAVMLSLFNIGGAVVFGRSVVPYLWHRNRALTLAAVAMVIVFLGWSLLLNLAIGHFRDLYIGNAGHVSQSVLRNRLFATPFGLTDTTSLVLVGVGLAFCAIAVLDAFGLDDPYPGYGRLGRQRASALTTYSDHRSRCLADLRARRDGAISEMSQIIEDIRRRQHDVQLAINGRLRLHQQYEAYLEHLRECHVRLVQRYREANIRARTSPPPSHFSGSPAVPMSLAPPAPLFETGVEAQINQYVIERMEHFIREMSKAFEAQSWRYIPVADIVKASEDENPNV
jgi:hypothetical protein